MVEWSRGPEATWRPAAFHVITCVPRSLYRPGRSRLTAPSRCQLGLSKDGLGELSVRQLKKVVPSDQKVSKCRTPGGGDGQRVVDPEDHSLQLQGSHSCWRRERCVTSSVLLPLWSLCCVCVHAHVCMHWAERGLSEH